MEGEVRRSPRISELARLRAEHENEQQQQREVRLLNNRTLVSAKRDSMSKEEKDALLEQRRNAYRLRALKRGQGNKDGDKAETSSAHELIPAANQFIPRRSPRFLEQNQQQGAVGDDNEANQKLEMVTKQRETQLQERRIRYIARRKSLTEGEKEKIREYKRIAYMKRGSATASEGSSDQVATMNSGIGTDSERSKNCPLEVDELLEHHAKDRDKRIRIERKNVRMAGRSPLTEKERELILEKGHTPYQINRTKVGYPTNNECRAGTSNGEPNHSGRGSNTSSRDNSILSGSTIFIPRRSPRIAEKVQDQEQLDDIAKERGKKQFHESVGSENESQETRRQERRSSLSEKEREHILENRGSAYQMKRRKVGDAEGRPESSAMAGSRPTDLDPHINPQVTQHFQAIPEPTEMGGTRVHNANIIITRRSPRFIEQIQCQDEDAAEASRKRKGKAVVPYQKRRRRDSYVPEIIEAGPVVINSVVERTNHDSSDDSSSDDGEAAAETAPHQVSIPHGGESSHAAQLPLRRSPRFSQHPQQREPATDGSPALNLRRSPRLMGQANSQGRRIGRPRQSVVGRSSFHNCARGLTYQVGFKKYHLPLLEICPKCQAMLFFRESENFCCGNGKISLQLIEPPLALLELFDDQGPRGKHFRINIRSYNRCFAFTSMGVYFDRDLADATEGVYTFRIQGHLYHKIGSLLPGENSSRPRYLQIYFYDTDQEIEWRMKEGNDVLDRDVLKLLREILNRHNSFVHVFRQGAEREDLLDCQLIIKEQPKDQLQYILPSASQVAAIVPIGDTSYEHTEREIIVQTRGGNLLQVFETGGNYDPMQYPLFLPYGSYGWDIESKDNNGRKMSCRGYYSYIMQMRNNHDSLFLRGGRLLQQYVVDNWVKIDAARLRWVTGNQKKLRAELYEGLQDAQRAGETSVDELGKKIVLPSSYIGGPRDMYQRYQDAMALVQKYGKPDLFLTMTCNPHWPEIEDNLLPGQSASGRPDLTTRAFRARFEELKEDILNKNVLGRVAAHVHVIEFQKRGLPHVHMLIILEKEDKLQGPDDYDRVVRAEIPDKNKEPELYKCVKKWMIHGPCGSKCMRDGKCKRGFPKQFSECTVQGKDAYPVYQRRDDDNTIRMSKNFVADNRFVVPYNPWLLQKYDCHINVEVCSTVQSVKYLYKYVYKGPDCISFGVRPVHPESENDEVTRYINARWVCAQEAMWRIYRFAMNKMCPAVQRLHLHLPKQNSVMLYEHQTVNEVLANENNAKTMLTEYFVTNACDPMARRWLYREFPEHYKWDKATMKWQRRRTKQRVIGRVYSVPPTAAERFFLRLLLMHVRGPTSYEDLLTVDGKQFRTFKSAAEARGLLENDNSLRACMAEAATNKMPSALRTLFGSILVFCNSVDTRKLWEEFFSDMVEDYASSSDTSSVYLSDRLLRELGQMLHQHGKRLKDYDLPAIVGVLGDNLQVSDLIEEEVSIPVSEEDMMNVHKLNEDQSKAYDSIMESVRRKESRVFFVDGPGGTGKTFLYRAILSTVRRNGGIAIATATSGVAATMLPGGRTAHSRFKLPFTPAATSACDIAKNDKLADLLRQATVIMWDEATMAHRYSVEAFDTTMRDITGNEKPFGGKIVIMGGDFRQVLPVVPKASRGKMVDSCLTRSSLWRHVEVLRLKKNMRAVGDTSYSDFLMRVGDGNEPSSTNDMIKMPDDMVIPWTGEDSVSQLIDATFPDLAGNSEDQDYLLNRALITPLNEHVDKLNDRVVSMFPGQEHTYYSFDSVEDDFQNLYLQEQLNGMAPGGLPPHELKLKLGAPIMLLRNVSAKDGLCNGTRLIIKKFFPNCIDAVILSGNSAGKRVFLHRMPMSPPDNLEMPFKMIRKQFPVRMCFAFTINKAQGQTIENTGIYLPDHVFSHGQLYVGLSRGVSSNNTKVLIKKGRVADKVGTFTKNVVYKEVLTSS